MRLFPICLALVLLGTGCSGPYTTEKVAAKETTVTDVTMEELVAAARGLGLQA